MRTGEDTNEYALERARKAKLKLGGGIAFGAAGAITMLVGLMWHDHAVMVGGFLAGAVATGIIPFAEARKLWPWGGKGDSTEPPEGEG